MNKLLVWIVVIVVILALAIWGLSQMGNSPDSFDGGDSVEGSVDGGDGSSLINSNILDEEDTVSLGSII